MGANDPMVQIYQHTCRGLLEVELLATPVCRKRAEMRHTRSAGDRPTVLRVPVGRAAQAQCLAFGMDASSFWLGTETPRLFSGEHPGLGSFQTYDTHSRL